MKAPLFPMEASEKGASGSQISPGEEKRSDLDLFKKDQKSPNEEKRIVGD